MNIKTCGICEKGQSKYKCPKCRVPYCSAACCKSHKEEGCKLPEPQAVDDKNENDNKGNNIYKFPTEDTVPLEKLQELRQSAELRQCLRNPHVRDIMKAILNDSNPTKAISLAMTEPIFVEVADACLKVVEPNDEDKPC